MDEQNYKIVKESIISGLFIFFLVYLGLSLFSFILGGVFSGKNPFDMYLSMKIAGLFLVLSLITSFSLSISFIYGKGLLQKEYSKKIFYKMPLFTLGLSFLISLPLMFIWGASTCSAEGCAFMILFVPLCCFFGAICLAIVSILFATYFYSSQNKIYLKKFFVWLFIIILIVESVWLSVAILQVSTSQKCGVAEYECVVKNALKENNLFICDQMGDFIKHRCFAQYGIAKNDPSVCNYIIKEAERGMCYGEVKKAEAVNKNDPSICNQIENEFMKNQCLDQFK